MFDKHNPIDSDGEDNDEEDNDNESSMQAPSTTLSSHIASPISLCKQINYTNDEFDNYSPDDHVANEENGTPLFNDNSITLNQVVHMLIIFPSH